MTQIEAVLKRDKLLVAGALVLFFLLAGLYTVLGVGMEMSAQRMTEMRHMRDMPGALVPGDWTLTHLVLIFLMWWVVMIAMMLPSAAPAILLHGALVRRVNGVTASSARLSACFSAGYLLAWAGFSLCAVALQWALEATGLVSRSMMTLIGTEGGAVVLIAAGLYQFMPVKAACLVHCRAPAEYLSAHWRPGSFGALRMGVGHGAYCVGCCWALMALLFVGGIMNLYWIVGLAVFVAVEKLLPWGWIHKLAGAALVLWGGSVLWASL